MRCWILLISDRKSHTRLQLLSICMTLNDLERSNSFYFALFHRLNIFWRIQHYSGWRWTYEIVNILSPNTVFYFGLQLSPTPQCGLSARDEHIVLGVCIVTTRVSKTRRTCIPWTTAVYGRLSNKHYPD